MLPPVSALVLLAFRGVLVDASQPVPTGFSAVVLVVDHASDAGAARRLQTAGLDLYYWFEVARSPRLAREHPEWMASLQGHPEWRRLFPNAPQPQPGEVVKNFPWVPILYKEAFDAHLDRLAALLRSLPAPRGIFLNDLQGAPSACGCGNDLCRWTTDYGPLRTATRLGPDAAASFLAAVSRLAPTSQIIPVWTTECEEDDKPDRCAGVNCFRGLCWKEYASQLTPVARQSNTVAVLAPYHNYQRDPAWVRRVVSTFPAQGVPAGRVIAVLQGWDVSPSDVAAQIDHAQASGAAGYLVARVKIDQSWEPRLHRLPR